MTCAIFDFETIAKHARLKALDGKPQNVVQPMGVQVDDGEQFDGYGMYAFAPSEVNPDPDWYASLSYKLPFIASEQDPA